jgi:DNA (cytosine-5)-methyltransferase 1
VKVLDLFSGIGGFTLGLDSTGFFETVKFVEKDKYCQKVLRKNFPNIPIEEDIKNVKGKEGDADVIVGGFPCQPMSVAGKRKGTDDDRYLWPEMFRLIREIKPQFVIGENVQGIINIQNGMVLRQVQDDLESEGFEVQCFLIPASGIGAWHQRYRVWIVGYSEHNGSLTSKIKRGDTKITTGTQEGTNTTREPKRTSRSRNNEDVSNTESIGTGESRNINQEKRSESSSSTQSNSSSEIKFSRENVENSNSGGGRREERSGQDDITRSSEEEQNHNSDKTSKRCGTRNFKITDDVSDTNSRLRGGRRTIRQSGENKVWRFRTEEEEQTRLNIRSETIGRDAVSGEEEVILQSNNERQQESNTSKESEGQTLNSRGHVADETKQTWWQIESKLCGIPNGISYELDKDRANRIKTLGNAIVPQIARELGLAIKKVMNEDTNI